MKHVKLLSGPGDRICCDVEDNQDGLFFAMGSELLPAVHVYVATGQTIGTHALFWWQPELN